MAEPQTPQWVQQPASLGVRPEHGQRADVGGQQRFPRARFAHGLLHQPCHIGRRRCGDLTCAAPVLVERERHVEEEERDTGPPRDVPTRGGALDSYPQIDRAQARAAGVQTERPVEIQYQAEARLPAHQPVEAQPAGHTDVRRADGDRERRTRLHGARGDGEVAREDDLQERAVGDGDRQPLGHREAGGRGKARVETAGGQDEGGVGSRLGSERESALDRREQQAGAGEVGGDLDQAVGGVDNAGDRRPQVDDGCLRRGQRDPQPAEQGDDTAGQLQDQPDVRGQEGDRTSPAQPEHRPDDHAPRLRPEHRSQGPQNLRQDGGGVGGEEDVVQVTGLHGGGQSGMVDRVVDAHDAADGVEGERQAKLDRRGELGAEHGQQRQRVRP